MHVIREIERGGGRDCGSFHSHRKPVLNIYIYTQIFYSPFIFIMDGCQFYQLVLCVFFLIHQPVIGHKLACTAIRLHKAGFAW